MGVSTTLAASASDAYWDGKLKLGKYTGRCSLHCPETHTAASRARGGAMVLVRGPSMAPTLRAGDALLVADRERTQRARVVRVAVQHPLRPAQQVLHVDRADLRIDTTEVRIPVSVTLQQSGKLVTGLEVTNFELYEDVAPALRSLVEDLADAFGNAAVGATRAVTDEGWRPHSDQIGTSR